jgi:hypothetical protein
MMWEIGDTSKEGLLPLEVVEDMILHSNIVLSSETEL